jgi:hypothetical protein
LGRRGEGTDKRGGGGEQRRDVDGEQTRGPCRRWQNNDNGGARGHVGDGTRWQEHHRHTGDGLLQAMMMATKLGFESCW